MSPKNLSASNKTHKVLLNQLKDKQTSKIYKKFEKDQGCTMILGVKDQYPKANQSVIQKAEYEKKKFNCEKKS